MNLSLLDGNLDDVFIHSISKYLDYQSIVNVFQSNSKYYKYLYNTNSLYEIKFKLEYESTYEYIIKLSNQSNDPIYSKYWLCRLRDLDSINEKLPCISYIKKSYGTCNFSTVYFSKCLYDTTISFTPWSCYYLTQYMREIIPFLHGRMFTISSLNLKVYGTLSTVYIDILMSSGVFYRMNRKKQILMILKISYQYYQRSNIESATDIIRQSKHLFVEPVIMDDLPFKKNLCKNCNWLLIFMIVFGENNVKYSMNATYTNNDHLDEIENYYLCLELGGYIG